MHILTDSLSIPRKWYLPNGAQLQHADPGSACKTCVQDLLAAVRQHSAPISEYRTACVHLTVRHSGQWTVVVGDVWLSMSVFTCYLAHACKPVRRARTWACRNRRAQLTLSIIPGCRISLSPGNLGRPSPSHLFGSLRRAR